ncbi:MAG: flavin reductase family protein [Defluviitaleaceae bacterium]|nr:flavin reductase family protein [Defluviitaleaceae bacterium]
MHPKAMFLYGTNKEDKSPNFALFTWITGCWNGEDSIMVCIGENKLTKDRILAEGKFSANLVSEAMIPLADYFGNNSGYNANKMNIEINVGRGEVLDIPILTDSPLIYELEVTRHIALEEDSSIFVCKVHNVIKPKKMKTDGESNNLEDLVALAPPALTIGYEYFTVEPTSKGSWGQWKEKGDNNG